MSQTVLVVESDSTTRDRIAAQLTLAGYRALGAGTFQDARRALREYSPDVLVTELRLNGYNGLQLLATHAKPLPAIVVTDFADQTLEAEARHLGAEYLMKPVDTAALLERIERVLARVPVGQQLFGRARRWVRKPVTELTASVGAVRARILDVSYGGIRFEIQDSPAACLPREFKLALDANGTRVELTAVWRKVTGDLRWVYGASVPGDGLDDWRGLIDGLS